MGISHPSLLSLASLGPGRRSWYPTPVRRIVVRQTQGTLGWMSPGPLCPCWPSPCFDADFLVWPLPCWKNQEASGTPKLESAPDHLLISFCQSPPLKPSNWPTLPVALPPGWPPASGHELVHPLDPGAQAALLSCFKSQTRVSRGPPLEYPAFTDISLCLYPAPRCKGRNHRLAGALQGTVLN